jgi:RNA polymerase sigma-70 factor (ECF subfamily)
MPEDAEANRERDLIQQARSNPDAFRELYDRYCKRVYGYVAARIPAQADADDVAADIFLSVVKHLHRLNNHHQQSFATWVFTIARNAIANYYRRAGWVESQLSLEDDLLADDQQLVEVALAARETAAELRSLVDSLPRRRREIIILRYFSGLRNHEIAEVLQIDEHTVASNLSRGLQQLYQQYTMLQSNSVKDRSSL